MNVTLYSDSEQISTQDVPEPVLTLWLAHIQEESHMKSENIKFGIRQRMKEGKAVLNHTQFLGYTKGKDGQLIIIPEAAEIVRKIFDLYLQGYGVRKIKRWRTSCSNSDRKTGEKSRTSLDNCGRECT